MEELSNYREGFQDIKHLKDEKNLKEAELMYIDSSASFVVVHINLILKI